MTAEASILRSVRSALALDALDDSFDSEILLHVNSALATLHQNGVGLPVVVSDEFAIWDDLRDPAKSHADYMFEQIKLYVFTKTKLLFDPPPPSTAKYMSEASDELLWRLRESYDSQTTVEEVI